MRSLAFVLSLLSLLACGRAAQKGAIEKADLFLFSLRDGRWQYAYNQLDPYRQEDCGSPDQMAENIIALFEARMTEWTLEIESAYRSRIILEAMVAREGRDTIEVGFVTEGVGEQWRIELFEVAGRELCAPDPEANLISTNLER